MVRLKRLDYANMRIGLQFSATDFILDFIVSVVFEGLSFYESRCARFKSLNGLVGSFYFKLAAGRPRLFPREAANTQTFYP